MQAAPKIRGDAKSVRDLLFGIKYHLDYYQRDYSWSSRQIRELVEDLTERFLHYYNSDDKRIDVRNYGQYFLGSIIISEKDNKLYIVDGQQRLTSLTLLLIYLKHLQRDTGVPEAMQVDVKQMIRSERYGETSVNINDEEDRSDCINGLFESPLNFDTSKSSESASRMAERYNDIEEFFPTHLCDAHVLPFFIDWLIDNVLLVVVTAYSDDDAYTIFETMNDRGLSLTPIDMLKGYLLAKLDSENDRKAAGDIWKENIRNLKDIGKDEDSDFMKSWLRGQYAVSMRETKAGSAPQDFDKIGTEFHRWIRSNANTIIGGSGSEDFMEFIKDKFCYFANAYSIARSAANEYNLDARLRSIYFNAKINFTLQYHLLLAPLCETDNEEVTVRKMALVATYLEILLARRIWNFKTITHSTMRDGIYRSIKKIRRLDVDKLQRILIEMLRTSDDAPNLNFDTEEGFRLQQNNRSLVHHILARLTEYVDVESGTQYNFSDYAKSSSRRSSYQIEHIWPDKFDFYKDEFAHPEDFKAYRDRIGGLLLLKGVDNASYGSKPYGEKVEFYLRQNWLAKSLNKSVYKNSPEFQRLCSKLEPTFKPYDEFGKEQLDERQMLYIEIAKHCWSPERLNSI